MGTTADALVEEIETALEEYTDEYDDALNEMMALTELGQGDDIIALEVTFNDQRLAAIGERMLPLRIMRRVIVNWRVALAPYHPAAAEDLMDRMIALLRPMFDGIRDGIRLRVNQYVTDTGRCFHSRAQCKNSKTSRLVANAPLRLAPCKHCVQV